MRRIPVSTAAIVLGMCVLWIVMATELLPTARKHDFLSFYMGGRLILDGRVSHIYDTGVQLAEERRFVPELPQLVPFIRPISYAIALAPVAALPYNVAFLAWIAMQILLLIGCWIWAWRRFGPDALVYCALSLPAPLGIASGQDCVVMLALLIVAFELNERGRAAASGAVLGLMLFKFHIALLWPVAILMQRRWRMLGGYCAMAAAEVLVSLAFGGISGARAYVALLTNKNLEHLSPSPQLMISYQGFLANLGIASGWAAGLLIGVVMIAFVMAIRTGPMFVLVPLASLMIVPHVYGYDAAVLVGPILWTIFESRAKAPRIVAALLATPIPFGFALADKPWAIIASASLMTFFLVLAANAKKWPRRNANKHE